MVSATMRSISRNEHLPRLNAWLATSLAAFIIHGSVPPTVPA